MSSIDLRTVAIEPQRNTFDHIAARFGDKPASRYQEGSYNVQAAANFHYRPTWEPQYEIFDTSRTKIVMDDWYSFRDPRQYYYGAYTLARAKMQEHADASFTFVEQRNLADTFDAETSQLVIDVIVPLRHVAWGANMNNAFVSAYGYGTTFTQPCLFAAMDQLGIAQYLTRLGLLLGGEEALAAGKQAWLEAEMWQPLRKLIEDSWVVKDPFELFVLQNAVLDALLYPLIYTHVDNALVAAAGPTVSMMVQFQIDWFKETSKWVDLTMKTAAAESDANRDQLAQWLTHWSERVVAALTPIAERALGAESDALATVQADLVTRAAKKWKINFGGEEN